MNRKDFGKLVEALRKEHTDENLEIWTQAKLAEESGLPVSLIGNIERGTKAQLRPEDLLALAKGLLLTSRERYAFFAAASGIDEEFVSKGDKDSQAILQDLTDILRQMKAPAFIVDPFGDVVVSNVASLMAYDINFELFLVSSQNSETNFNVMSLVYAPEFQRQRSLIGEGKWANFSYNAVMIFRLMTFTNRSHPYFQYLLRTFRKKYPHFREAWDSVYWHERDHLIDNTTLNLSNSTFGELKQIASDIVAITPNGQLRLYSFVPLNHETADAYRLMFQQGGEKIIPVLPDWPERPYPKSKVNL